VFIVLFIRYSSSSKTTSKVTFDNINLNYSKPAKDEVKHIINEIWKEKVYYQKGITLKDSSVVFDVGSNIGMFALWINSTWRNCQVFCFEPLPPNFHILSKNKDDNAFMKDSILCNYGLGSQTANNVQFSYFPTLPANSTMFLQEKFISWDSVNREVGATFLKGAIYYIFLLAGPFRAPLYKLLMSHLKKTREYYTCSVRTISDVIDEHQVKNVDLLKVDAEGAELEVLLGIQSDEHWKMIQQIAMEVLDYEGRMETVKSLLNEKGFLVTYESDSFAKKAFSKDMMLYYVYATRSTVTK